MSRSLQEISALMIWLVLAVAFLRVRGFVVNGIASKAHYTVSYTISKTLGEFMDFMPLNSSTELALPAVLSTPCIIMMSTDRLLQVYMGGRELCRHSLNQAYFEANVTLFGSKTYSFSKDSKNCITVREV